MTNLLPSNSSSSNKSSIRHLPLVKVPKYTFYQVYCYLCILVTIQFVLKCSISVLQPKLYTSKLLCLHFGLPFYSFVYYEYLACSSMCAEHTHTVVFSSQLMLASFAFSFFYFDLPGICTVTRCKFVNIFLHGLLCLCSTILDLNLLFQMVIKFCRYSLHYFLDL